MKGTRSWVWLIIIAIIISGCQVREEKRSILLDNTIVRSSEPYDFEKMEKDLLSLQEKYPENLKVITLGVSVEGRKLYGVSMGSGPKTLLISASIHGREWMTSYLVMNLMELYLRYEKAEKKLKGYNISELFKETTLYFIPMVNPDGVDLVLNGLGSRDETKLMNMNEDSKDFSRWKANIEGVDLNRQFDAHWEETESKVYPSFENYKGERILDQPESLALVHFTEKTNPDIVVAYHLSGSVIFWYYNQTGARLKRDYKIAKKCSKLTGYKLVDEEYSDAIAAGYKDWFVKRFEKPGYTIEIGDKRYDELALQDIDRFIQENIEVLLYLAKTTSKKNVSDAFARKP